MLLILFAARSSQESWIFMCCFPLYILTARCPKLNSVWSAILLIARMHRKLEWTWLYHALFHLFPERGTDSFYVMYRKAIVVSQLDYWIDKGFHKSVGRTDSIRCRLMHKSGFKSGFSVLAMGRDM